MGEPETIRGWSSPNTLLYMEAKSMVGTVRVPSMSNTTPRSVRCWCCWCCWCCCWWETATTAAGAAAATAVAAMLPLVLAIAEDTDDCTSVLKTVPHNNIPDASVNTTTTTTTTTTTFSALHGFLSCFFLPFPSFCMTHAVHPLTHNSPKRNTNKRKGRKREREERWR
jgi:hypothetical protein